MRAMSFRWDAHSARSLTDRVGEACGERVCWGIPGDIDRLIPGSNKQVGIIR